VRCRRNFPRPEKEKKIVSFKNKILWPTPLLLLFNTQTMHIKSFYTQQHCYVSLQKNLYPGGIQTRVFLFLRQMRCPLRHAAMAKKTFKNGCKWPHLNVWQNYASTLSYLCKKLDFYTEI
jgi:hypothetical protein